MDGATLTARYLEEVRHRGLRASELLGDLPASEFLNAFYAGRYLSRPLFIGASELARLYADVESVRACVVSLPDRLFGGNFAAFARAAGAGETFIAAAQRDPNTPLTRLTRADLCADESGFHLLEINMSSAIGGVANVDMCRGLLEHPVLADFARRHDLGYVDTRREQIASAIHLEGIVDHRINAGSHSLFAVCVDAAEVNDRAPLVSFDHGFRRLAQPGAASA